MFTRVRVNVHIEHVMDNLSAARVHHWKVYFQGKWLIPSG